MQILIESIIYGVSRGLDGQPHCLPGSRHRSAKDVLKILMRGFDEIKNDYYLGGFTTTLMGRDVLPVVWIDRQENITGQDLC